MSAQCRSVAASQQEVSSLEVRAAKAEQAQGDAMRELREAEVAAADQETLLLRAAALEDKLRESRGEQGQLENYKQVSQALHVLVCTCAKWQLSSACPSAQDVTKVSLWCFTLTLINAPTTTAMYKSLDWAPNSIQEVADLAGNVELGTCALQ